MTTYQAPNLTSEVVVTFLPSYNHPTLVVVAAPPPLAAAIETIGEERIPIRSRVDSSERILHDD
jgi:hypothetical protein